MQRDAAAREVWDRTLLSMTMLLLAEEVGCSETVRARVFIKPHLSQEYLTASIPR
jgi:hypothetical protein